MTRSLQGRFVANKPTDYLVIENNVNNEVARKVFKYNDGLPNFSKGTFHTVEFSYSFDIAKDAQYFDLIANTAITAKVHITNMPQGYVRVWQWYDYLRGATMSSDIGHATASTRPEFFTAEVQ